VALATNMPAGTADWKSCTRQYTRSAIHSCSAWGGRCSKVRSNLVC